jgi:mannose-6-phosphate isomerase
MSANDGRTPLVLEPKLTTAIWGGDALVRRYGKPGDPTAALGESWECWDENRIAAGPFAGQTLAAVRVRLGAALMGPIDPAQRFPVLTKIIDARDALSVQVHPGDAYAQRVEGEPFGKTECWTILEAAAGAELVLGWTHDTERAEVERRIADGTLGEILRRVAVQPGQTFYLPAGTLHAIGAGIQLFETQQASDLTYRLFDWNRVGADGQPRQLHFAKAADVLEYRATLPEAVPPLAFTDAGATRVVTVAATQFAVERVTFGARGATLAGAGRPLVVLAASAPLRLDTGDGTLLDRWQTALVPAAAERVTLTAAGGEATAFVVRPDPDLGRLRAEAAAAGASDAALDAFFAQF